MEKMNITFVDPPSLMGTAFESESTKMSTPNMGILYIATYIKQKTDANVTVLDMIASNLSFLNVSDILKKTQPSIVCISTKTFNILAAYKLSNIIKKINERILIIVGGAHPTALPDHTLNECPDVDAVALREGEDTVLEIYERMKKSNKLSKDVIFDDVFGVVYRDDSGQIIHNKERKLIADLDTLPFPDMSLVPYKRYQRVYNSNKHKFQHIYPVFASRGCPFNCSFCMPLHTRKHRVRSIDNILDEIELLNKKHGAERIYFEDSLFYSKKDWFFNFCEKYQERDLHKKVQWGFETRIDTASTEMFSQAKKAGCIYTFFGVESGSESVLAKANKGYSRDSIIEKVTSAKQAEINEVNISIILGLPFETMKSIEETLSLIEELPCDNANINILDIYPGTATFEMADKGEGGLKWLDGKRMNWTSYSRLDPMVEVNDITSKFLLLSREKGLRIMAKKSRKNIIDFNLKRFFYIIELLKTDRQGLYKKIKYTFRKTL